jgi:hypothetical protein
MGEGRRLTAAWINIMAAGLVSAGSIPVLTALALEGWGAHARALAPLPAFALGISTLLHSIARLTLREKSLNSHGASPRVTILASTGEKAGSCEDARDYEEEFPSERDIDAVMEEFGQDSRAVIRALLHDLDVIAADAQSQASTRDNAPRAPRDRAACER